MGIAAFLPQTAASPILSAMLDELDLLEKVVFPIQG